MSRHRERPSKRVNPSGKTVWVARYTNLKGERVYAKPRATFATRGPCKAPTGDGQCCAQHAIDAAYAAQERTPGGAMTVGEYARTWPERRPRSERTNATNAHRLAQLLGPLTREQLEYARRMKGTKREPRPGVKVERIPLADWPLAEVRRRHVEDVLHELLTVQGRSAAGAKNLLLTLSAMFSDAVRDDLMEVNPCREVRVRRADPRVSKPSREPKVLSWQEMHKFAAAAGEHEAMVRVVADCGLRLGELLGLAAEDVKLAGCAECEEPGPHLHVRRTAHEGVVQDGTKRERLRDRFEGGRVVPLPAQTASLLRALPTRIAGPMFFTPTGRVWRADNFRQDVWNVARKASGVDGSPQDFRVSWVSNLRAAGVDPADLAQMAGHSVEVATAVYTKALGRSYDAVRKAVGQ
jgi:integrase